MSAMQTRLHRWPVPWAVTGGILTLAAGLALAFVFVAQNADNLAYRRASPCSKDARRADDCVATQTGKVEAISTTRYEDVDGGYTSVSLTLQLPGQAPVAVLPQARLLPVLPRVGDGTVPNRLAASAADAHHLRVKARR
jgi:hypothetical protein